MAIWVTSDWHFGHNKTFVWQARGFNSINEMNETIIKNHNLVVDEDDDVYVLGDLILGYPDNLDYVRRLNGKLHIVRGNHDTNQRWELYKTLPNVVEMDNAIYLQYKKYHFYMSHFPTITSNNDYDKPLSQRTLNLCGHTHTTDPWQDADKGYIYHCEVDAHNCYPVGIEAILHNFHSHFKASKQEYEILQCNKCVWQYTDCAGPICLDKWDCPAEYTFKRDPPDGGYYG